MKATDASTDVKQLTYLGAEKTSIVVMETDELRAFVDKFVRSCLNKVDEREENGKPTKAAIVAADKLDEYLEEQMAMFASRGLDKFRAYKEAVVPTGEYFTNRFGEQVEKLRIIVRDVKLEPVEDFNEKDHVATAREAFSYSSWIGVERDKKRGKYNDAGLLIEQSSKSVDASEVVSFARYDS